MSNSLRGREGFGTVWEDLHGGFDRLKKRLEEPCLDWKILRKDWEDPKGCQKGSPYK